MEFKIGDTVKCVEPKSNSGWEFNLNENRIYEISHIGYQTITLKGSRLSYISSRFVLCQKEHNFDKLYLTLKG